MGLGEIAPRACRRLLAAHRILRRAGTKGRAISAERAGAIVDHDEERIVERQGRMAEQSRCEHVAPLHRQLVIQPGAERLATRGDRLGRRRWRRVAAARAGRPVTAGVITVVVLAVLSRTAAAAPPPPLIFGFQDPLPPWPPP